MKFNGKTMSVNARFTETMIPCWVDSGNPNNIADYTQESDIAVGQLYMNSDNGDLYKCVAENDGVYTWKIVGGEDVAKKDLVIHYWEDDGSLSANIEDILNAITDEKIVILFYHGIYFNKQMIMSYFNGKSRKEMYAEFYDPTSDAIYRIDSENGLWEP